MIFKNCKQQPKRNELALSYVPFSARNSFQHFQKTLETMNSTDTLMSYFFLYTCFITNFCLLSTHSNKLITNQDDYNKILHTVTQIILVQVSF